MAFRHGKDTWVGVGPYDLTNWLNSASIPADVEVAETSHFGTQAKTYIPGVQDSKVTLGGLFDSDPLLLENKLQAIADDPAGMPVTIAQDGGAAVGRRAAGTRALRTQWQIETQISDVAKVGISLQGTGGVNFGWMLTDAASHTTTVTGDGVDGGAVTLAGGYAYVHVVANTSTSNTIKVQHSTDNLTWVDLSSTQALASANPSVTYYVLTFNTQTVNRYLRAVLTIGSGSATAVVSAFRN